LSGSLARLWAELARLREADDAWTRAPAPGAWSANEIALHLRDVEAEVNGPRIDAVLTQENPFIAGVDTDQWATQRSYNTTDGRAALEGFAQTRLAVLRRHGSRSSPACGGWHPTPISERPVTPSSGAQR